MIFTLETYANFEMVRKFRLFWKSRDLTIFRDLLCIPVSAPPSFDPQDWGLLFMI